jgi:hypothetical protein
LTKNNYEEPSLREQILRECEAMAKYAFSSGLKVPTSVVKTLVHLGLNKATVRQQVLCLDRSI